VLSLLTGVPASAVTLTATDCDIALAAASLPLLLLLCDGGDAGFLRAAFEHARAAGACAIADEVQVSPPNVQLQHLYSIVIGV
jgi:hypothetical protein